MRRGRDKVTGRGRDRGTWRFVLNGPSQHGRHRNRPKDTNPADSEENTSWRVKASTQVFSIEDWLLTFPEMSR